MSRRRLRRNRRGVQSFTSGERLSELGGSPPASRTGSLGYGRAPDQRHQPPPDPARLIGLHRPARLPVGRARPPLPSWPRTRARYLGSSVSGPSSTRRGSSHDNADARRHARLGPRQAGTRPAHVARRLADSRSGRRPAQPVLLNASRHPRMSDDPCSNSVFTALSEERSR